MGNHSVGRVFHTAFCVIADDIDSMPKDELLKLLDMCGEQYRGSDAEFDDYTNPDYPLGRALIKIFNPDIGVVPNDDDDVESEKWWDKHYYSVYRPFRERYEFC